jgi:hypothetical protein
MENKSFEKNQGEAVRNSNKAVNQSFGHNKSSNERPFLAQGASSKPSATGHERDSMGSLMYGSAHDSI